MIYKVSFSLLSVHDNKLLVENLPKRLSHSKVLKYLKSLGYEDPVIHSIYREQN